MYRNAEDYPKQEKRFPVSTRIEESLLRELKQAAKDGDHNLSYLIGCILQDFAEERKGRKSDKRSSKKRRDH